MFFINPSDQTDGGVEPAAVEYWDRAIPEGHCSFRSDGKHESGNAVCANLNNTYRGLRMVGEDFSLYDSVWCSGKTEFFNLKASLLQTNIYTVSPKLSTCTFVMNSCC